MQNTNNNSENTQNNTQNVSEEETKNQNSQEQGQEQGKSVKDKNKGTKEDNLVMFKNRAFEAEKLLAKYKAKEAKEAEEEAKKKGEYEKLLQAKDAELEKIRQETELSSKKQLAKELAFRNGLNPKKADFFEKYVLNNLISGEDLEADFNSLKETAPELFSQKEVSNPSTPTGGGGNGASISKEEAKEILDSGNTELIQKHKDDLLKYNL